MLVPTLSGATRAFKRLNPYPSQAIAVPARFWHDAPMDQSGVALTVPDTPETRKLWLSDFRDEEVRCVLRTLLEAGFVEMTLNGKERGFRPTVIGRVELEAFSKRSLQN